MHTGTLSAPTGASTRSNYSYEAVLGASQKILWKVEDLIGGDKRLDFTLPFMPESFARVQELPFLNARERLRLNQIRGHGYLYTFGLVEEFILPFVLDHARPQLAGDDWRTRAFLQFAAEEAKHIHLFKRFREEFRAGFGRECAVIGPPAAIAEAVLAKSPLGVALVILQIEWMSQRHYLDSIAEDRALDPQFKSLLRHHWMEEAQHAKLDTLMVEALAAAATPEERERGLQEYLEVGMFLDAGLKQQAQFDLETLEQDRGRAFSATERERFVAAQHQALRWTYLGSGMTHPKFLDTLEVLGAGARRTIEEIAPTFC